jgi:hypothetical protein
MGYETQPDDRPNARLLSLYVTTIAAITNINTLWGCLPIIIMETIIEPQLLMMSGRMKHPLSTFVLIKSAIQQIPDGASVGSLPTS